MKRKDFFNREFRTFLCLTILFCVNLSLSGQKKYVLKDIQTGKEFVKKDSASAVKFLDSLTENRYYFTQISSVKKNGSQTEIFFDKGRDFNQGYVQFSESLRQNQPKQSEIFVNNIDSLKKTIIENFVQEGYTFSRLKTVYKGMRNGNPILEFSANLGSHRTVNGFAVKGYEKVPKRFVRNLEKNYSGKHYSSIILKKIDEELRWNPFILSERAPQTLFTKDSTKIFLFLQKKKSNTFDGVLGFGNDKNRKFSLNGNLNVGFRNMFNGFEEINLFWQRNPDRGQTFNLHTDIPYLFKSNTGLDLHMNIFRQDSTFATVKILPSVYYHLNHHQKIGIRGTFDSSAVLDSLYTSGKDLTKKGVGFWYNLTMPTEVELFHYKTKIQAEFDLLSTKYAGQETAAGQTNYFIFGEQNFHLSGNHYLNLKGESAMISGKSDIQSNELLRFGGWNSMRGFNENTLYADFYVFGGAEYRYLVNNQAFFDVFGQYAQLNNKKLALKPKLYSLGFGFNFFLPVGLMSFQISNGNQFGNSIRFSDTKIHWGILSRF